VRKVKFVQADVFTDSPFGGNSVVVVPEPGPMTADDMQRLARGMNFAETAFVVRPEDTRAAFGLKCYTPTTEVVYSGHQLLGTAFVLAVQEDLPLEDAATELLAEVGGRLQPVFFERSEGRIQKVSTAVRSAEFGETVGADGYGEVAAALSVDPMSMVRAGLPLQIVRTGLACLVVPIQSLLTLRELMPVEQALDEVLQEIDADCALAFCEQALSEENDLHVRVFAPPLGIVEDPATGAAAGALAAYLIRHGEISPTERGMLRCEQGTEMGRPSLVEVQLDSSSEPLVVRVGGRVALSAEGTVFY